MHLRTATLTALALVMVLPAQLWGGPGSTAGDSLLDGALERLREEAGPEPEVELDAALLAELDALLRDPIDLDRDDLERLRVLPWLGEAQVEALLAARPLRVAEDLAHVPGWDEALARRVLPFVRPPSPARNAVPVDLSLQATASGVRGRATARHASLAWHVSRAHREDPGIAARVRAGPWNVVLGDVRCGVGQGLVAWTSAETWRAVGDPWQRARGLVALPGHEAPNALRGAGVEYSAGRLRAIALCGRKDGEAVTFSSVTCRLHGDRELQLGAARDGGRGAASAGLSLGAPGRRLAIELVSGAGWRIAASAATELRCGALVLGARLRVTPDARPAALAASNAAAQAATRAAQVRVVHRWRGVEFVYGLASSSSRASTGVVRTRQEQAFTARASYAGNDMELGLQQREKGEEAWRDDADQEFELQVERGLRGRLKRDLGRNWSATAEFVLGESSPHDAPIRSGHVWRARLERYTGRVRPQLGVSAFVAPTGVLLVEPVLGTALGTSRLQGDGIRATGALRCVWGTLDALAGAWVEWRPDGSVRPVARAAIALRWP